MARRGIGSLPEQDVLDDVFSRLAGQCVGGKLLLDQAQLLEVERQVRLTWARDRSYIRENPMQAYRPVPISEEDVRQRGYAAVAKELGVTPRQVSYYVKRGLAKP